MHFLGSTSVCCVATLTPQLAFDSTIFTNLRVACFSLVRIHEMICINLYTNITNEGHSHIMPTTSVSAAGSMAREINDLILLDSIVRMPNITTTGHGMIPEPVSCAAPITNINLNGTRIGLPSTFGWATGLSGEVWFMI